MTPSPPSSSTAASTRSAGRTRRQSTTGPGAPLAKVKALFDHRRHRYDWRRCEAILNDWCQYKTCTDGLGIHFLHVRSKHENALPLSSPTAGPIQDLAEP